MCLHPWQHPAKHGRENGGVGMGANRQTASLLLVLLLPAVPCSAWEKTQSSGLGVLALTADGDAIIAGSGNGPGPVSAARVAAATGAEMWRTSIVDDGGANAVRIDGGGNAIVAAVRFAADRSETLVVGKLSGTTGTELWHYTLDDGAPSAIAVDGAGDVIVGGGASQAANFCVAKLSGTTGAELWRAGIVDGGSTAVAVDAAGDVIAGGSVNGAVRQGIVVKFAGATGGEVWRTTLSSSGDGSFVLALSLIGGTDVAITGVANNAGTDGDMMVAKLAGATGETLWRRDIDGTASGRDGGRGIAIDGAGDVLVAGITQNGGQPTCRVNGHGEVGDSGDFTVVKLEGTSGAEVWRRALNGSTVFDFGYFECSRDEAAAVAVTGAGDVVAVGFTSNTTTHQDFTIVKLSGADGHEIWRRLRPTLDENVATRVALDASEDVVAAGYTQLVKVRGADGADACGAGACDFCEGCTSSGDCVPTPRPPGRPPMAYGSPSSRLLIQQRSDTAADIVNWSWRPGTETNVADFSDPLTTGYALCVYDNVATGQQPRLVLRSTAPPAGTCGGVPCWKTGANSLLYRNRMPGPSELSLVHLHGGRDGAAPMTAVGRNANLGLPPTLGLTPPVVTQLWSERGECWETVHDASNVIVNRPDEFKARGSIEQFSR